MRQGRQTYPRKFLQAEWRKLILANYAVDPSILKPYLPYKTELDLWQDTCYVSLVGFMFVNTRVLGIKIPFHVNFEEVNLRFYVKVKDGISWKRGVVFVKEIVPKAAITFVANTLYKEHYHTMPMRHQWTQGSSLDVAYQWKYKGKWNEMAVKAGPDPIALTADSEEAFITEHYWGYTKIRENKTAEYGVEHPSWSMYPIQSYHMDIEVGNIYGSAFRHLEQEEPLSVFLAEGSEIIVRQGSQFR